MKGKFKHISFTQFDTAAQCMDLYHQLYPTVGERKEGRDTQDRMFGSFLHRCYEGMNKHIKGMKDKDALGVEDIKNIYAKEFEKVALTLEDYNIGWNSFEKYALETFNQRAEILMVEEELVLELVDGKEGIAIVGVPDRVDEAGDALKVIDYKLSPLVPSHSDVEHDLQGNIYAYILKTLYPDKQIFIEKYSMISGKGVKALVLDEVQAKLQDYMIAVWRKMRTATEWPPTLCKKCQYCPQVCKLYKDNLKQTYEAKGVKNLKQAISAYETAKINEGLMKKEKESLKEYLELALEKSNGQPIIEGGKMLSLGIGGRTSPKIDKEKICTDRNCPAITYSKSQWNEVEIVDAPAKKGKK